MIDVKQVLDTKQSRLNFMKGLIAFAKANNKIDNSERQFYVNAALNLELGEEDIAHLDETLFSEDICPDIKFASKKQAIFFLREALQLCYIDSVYDIEEKKITENVRVLNSLTAEEVKRIEDWVLEGIAWSNKGEKLLEMED